MSPPSETAAQATSSAKTAVEEAANLSEAILESAVTAPVVLVATGVIAGA